MLALVSILADDRNSVQVETIPSAFLVLKNLIENRKSKRPLDQPRYKEFQEQLQKRAPTGQIEVRVFRPLHRGPLFDLTKLKEDKWNPQLLFDRMIGSTPLNCRYFTIEVPLAGPVRIYRLDPMQVAPAALTVCHSVTFGVGGGWGHLHFGDNDEGKWRGFLIGIIPPQHYPFPTQIVQAAKIYGLYSALLIPPETTNTLLNNTKLFEQVKNLNEIRPGDIIAFYNTKEVLIKIPYGPQRIPAGSLLHTMPVTAYVTPTPRPLFQR
ncbi:MAG: hypothetical protein KatS3mg107_1273 [Gemmataceae bacterium]|nr:MAG: hypothetical protein KatS3mg107_1273 [Gemmataceae bacterium]